MRGHIARKGNRYYAVVYEGIDPATGKGRHRWHSGRRHPQRSREGARRAGQADPRRRLPLHRIGSPLPTTSPSGGCRCGDARSRHSTYRSYVANTRLHVAALHRQHPAAAAHARATSTTSTTELLTDGRRNGAGRWTVTEDRPQRPQHAAQGARRRVPGRAPCNATSPLSPTHPSPDGHCDAGVDRRAATAVPRRDRRPPARHCVPPRRPHRHAAGRGARTRTGETSTSTPLDCRSTRP